MLYDDDTLNNYVESRDYTKSELNSSKISQDLLDTLPYDNTTDDDEEEQNIIKSETDQQAETPEKKNDTEKGSESESEINSSVGEEFINVFEVCDNNLIINMSITCNWLLGLFLFT